MMSLVFRDLYEFRHLSSASGCVNAWETSQFLNLVCVNGQCSTCVPSRLRQFGNVRLIFGRWRCWTFWSRPDNASEIEITRPSHRLSPCLMGFCYRITRLQIQTAKQQNSTVFGETVLAILFSYVSVCTKDLCLCSQARSLGYPNTMLCYNTIWIISSDFFKHIWEQCVLWWCNNFILSRAITFLQADMVFWNISLPCPLFQAMQIVSSLECACVFVIGISSKIVEKGIVFGPKCVSSVF